MNNQIAKYILKKCRYKKQITLNVYEYCHFSIYVCMVDGLPKTILILSILTIDILWNIEGIVVDKKFTKWGKNNIRKSLNLGLIVRQEIYNLSTIKEKINGKYLLI